MSGILCAIPPEASRSAFEQFVSAGGPVTWFVLIPLSMATVAMIVHFLTTIRRGREVPPALVREIVSAAGRRDTARIMSLSANGEGMLAHAALAATGNVAQGRDQAASALDEAVEEQAGKLMRRIEYLNVVGNVSPMIGLLGTVIGMIQAFNRIYAAGGSMPDASKLVGDIAVALVNTFWGLAIAVPALSAYAFFRNRIDAFASDSIRLCDGIVDLEPAAGSTAASRA